MEFLGLHPHTTVRVQYPYTSELRLLHMVHVSTFPRIPIQSHDTAEWDRHYGQCTYITFLRATDFFLGAFPPYSHWKQSVVGCNTSTTFRSFSILAIILQKNKQQSITSSSCNLMRAYVALDKCRKSLIILKTIITSMSDKVGFSLRWAGHRTCWLRTTRSRHYMIGWWQTVSSLGPYLSKNQCRQPRDLGSFRYIDR